MAHKDTLWEKLLRCVRENPGISGADLQTKFIQDHTKHSISSSLGQLQRMGLIKHRGNMGRWTVWDPVEVRSVDIEILEMAEWLLDEMKKLPRSERALFLAVHISDLTGGK